MAVGVVADVADSDGNLHRADAGRDSTGAAPRITAR